jgi:outer membrane receptor protein involved in Fe transport
MSNRKIATPTQVAAAAALAVFQLSVAHAQANNDALKLDEVVVTGSATGGSKMKQSLSISTMDSEQLTNSVASSSADLLRSIPGVRAESSGGEGNANVTVRGVPISAGGSRYVQFQEDGLPVLQLGDFNFMTPDMFLRSSLGTDGLEVVRGGSASTMATNAPGGIINFISKTGDVEGGTISATTNVSGPSQRRVDFGYGKATSDTSSVYLSGFVRSGEGPRDTHGVNMESGGQFKASFNKDLGSGNSIKLHAKFLDDKTPTLMTSPVNTVNGQIVRIPGVDPRTFSPYASNLPTISQFGRYGGAANMNDGLQSKSTSLGGEINLNLGDNWILNEKFRLSNNSGGFSGIMPANYGSYPDPLDATKTKDYLLPQNGVSTYKALFLGAKFNDAGLAVNDLKLSKKHAMADGAKLTTTAGLFASSQKLDIDWEIGGFTAPLVPTGSSSYGAYESWYKRYINQTYTTVSPYAALAWERGAWNLDASIRADRQSVTGSYEDPGKYAKTGATVGTNDTAVGSRGIDYKSNFTAYSFGANYALDKNTSLFARVSEGASFNSDRVLFQEKVDVCGNRCFVGKSVPVNQVKQYEAGFKNKSGNLSTFVTFFLAKTDESNYDLTTGTTSFNKYSAKGVELEAGYRMGAFRINGGLTLTDAEVTSSNTAAYVGKAPNRQAKAIYQLSPTYKFGDTTVGAAVIGTTSSKDAQTVSGLEATLPAYTYVNAFATHDVNKSMTLSLSVNNLTNTLGYTEVNNERSAARSITGRTVKVGVKYNF